MTRLLFGYHLPNHTFRDVPDDQLFDHLVDLGCTAEEAGFGLLTVMDHFYQIRGIGPETDPMLEAYTTLGGLAARTSTVMLGTMVTGVTYRNPAYLAKIITTLDVMSRGRGMLGIGAAWNESEHAGYGYDFPPVKERMDRLDEALAICKAMFTEERPSFQGRYYQIDRALNMPRPVREGGPPIMVGGGGEQRTLRIAAKYADMTHWFALGLDVLNHKTEVLEKHCADVGRDPSTIRRMVGAPVTLAATERDAAKLFESLPPERRQMKPMTPDQAAERLRPYIDAGFGGFTFGNNLLPTKEAIGLGGELIRLLS